MKKSTFVLLMSAFAFLSVQAQVLEDTRVMNRGSQPALTIVLPGADAKFAETEWKEFMKPYGKIMRVKQAKEVVAEGVQVLDIGGVNRLNIYTLIEEVAEGAKLIVWIDMGGGFISSSTFPQEYPAAVKFLQEYAHKVKVDMIAIDLEAQQKQLGKFEGNLTKLQRENESLHKIIEDSKKRIAQAEQDIQKNLQDQDLAQKEVESQQSVVGTVQKKLEEVKAQKPN